MRELVFQRGKAMARPTSRMAKTVSVLATAQSIPARMAPDDQVLLFGEIGEDLPVPLSSVGTVQRAVKTPATMQSEIGEGREAGVDQLCGRFCGAEPDAGGKAADHADSVEGFDGAW